MGHSQWREGDEQGWWAVGRGVLVRWEGDDLLGTHMWNSRKLS